MSKPQRQPSKQASKSASGVLPRKALSAASSKNLTKKDATAAPKKATKRTEWALPAFSILPKKAKETINWEDLKKKTIRRQAPEGEDIKSIRNILKEYQNKQIPVHELINLVGPYTSDNGAVLRQVLEEDVDSFRKLSRKVYETQTQDVSDVLVNEQLQLVNFYQERHAIFSEKMMNAINEIYEMAPNFDFERFFRDRHDYLNMILPLPVEVTKAPEELEMQRRQMAYHRLQWLRSEGERMHEENKRLQQRLEELKKEQRNEQRRMAEDAAKVEEERQNLSKQEAEMKDRLQELNQDVEQSIIENEAQITQSHRAEAMQPSTGAIKKSTGKVKKQKRSKQRPEWVSDIAADIEEQAMKEVVAVEAQAAAEPPSSTRRFMRRHETTPQAPQQAPPRQTSPFHFSPEGAYGAQQMSPQPQQKEVRVETHVTNVQERRPVAEEQPRVPQYRGRRGQAPKDSWGGFY